MRINRDFSRLKKRLEAELRNSADGIPLTTLKYLNNIPQQTISHYLRKRSGVVKIGSARATKYKLIDEILFDKSKLNIVYNNNGFEVEFLAQYPKLEKLAWDFLTKENPNLQFPKTRISKNGNLIKKYEGQLKDIIVVQIGNGITVDDLEKSICPFQPQEKEILVKTLEMYNIMTASQFAGDLFLWIDFDLRLHCIPLSFTLVPALNVPLMYTVATQNKMLAQKFWKRNWHACQMDELESLLYQIADVF